MQEYAFDNFFNSLDESGRYAADAIRGYIAARHPEYKPVDVRPDNRALSEWTLNFRKKPKTGKALCTLYSRNGRLSARIVFLGFMKYETLLRINEFKGAARKYILLDLCIRCRTECEYDYRSYYYTQSKLHASSIPNCLMRGYDTEYAEIVDITKDDIPGIMKLIDFQSRHMTQDPRDIRGGGYMEANRMRCGVVEVVSLDCIKPDISNFNKSDYANEKKLNKYAAVYYLTAMGARDGLWFYHNGGVLRGGPAANCGGAVNPVERGAMVPEGRYATVTIYDPMSFSARRVWEYIAKWLWENNVEIRAVDYDNACGSYSAYNSFVAYFVKFYRIDDVEYMSMYVPVP